MVEDKSKTNDKIMKLVGKHIHRGNTVGAEALHRLFRKDSNVADMVCSVAYEGFLHRYKDYGRKGLGIPGQDIDIVVKRDQQPFDQSGRDPGTKYRVDGRMASFVFLVPGSVAYSAGTIAVFQDSIDRSNTTIDRYQEWNEFHRLCIVALRKHRAHVLSALPVKAKEELFENHWPDRSQEYIAAVA
jgi:hypothetical protein